MQIILKPHSGGTFTIDGLLYRFQNVMCIRDITNNKYYAFCNSGYVTERDMRTGYVFIEEEKRLRFSNYKDIEKMHRTGKMKESVKRPIRVKVLRQEECKGKRFVLVDLLVA